jgi:SAM-dependent methyltransferase
LASASSTVRVSAITVWRSRVAGPGLQFDVRVISATRQTNGDEGAALQRRVFRELRRGPDPEEVALHAVVEVAPSRVLDAGAGDGGFAERLADALKAEVIAVDISPRAVELARARGVDARVGDIQQLPFVGGSFDCVVANWMLYEVPDLDRALGEVCRVLGAGGRLVAGTVARDTFAEVRQLLGAADPPRYSFDAESGAARLRPYFRQIERRDVHGSIVFPNWELLRDFVAMAPERRPLLDHAKPFRGSFSTRNHLAVFVADKTPRGRRAAP